MAGRSAKKSIQTATQVVRLLQGVKLCEIFLFVDCENFTAEMKTIVHALAWEVFTLFGRWLAYFKQQSLEMMVSKLGK